MSEGSRDLLASQLKDNDDTKTNLRDITDIGKNSESNEIIETDALLAKASQADLISVRNTVIDQAAP